MAQARNEPEREERILMEVVVDAYGRDERWMGWYCYLGAQLTPFAARCTVEQESSPLAVGDEVEVLGMASDKVCGDEMRVKKRGLAVPLAQLKVIKGDDATRQAVEDWVYWVRRGLQLLNQASFQLAEDLLIRRAAGAAAPRA